MNLESLQAALPAGYALHHMPVTGSTNTDALNWVEAGHTPAALFIADTQNSARGRRGRNWSAPLGNIYASLVIPCPADMRTAGQYGFAISLAIQRMIIETALKAMANVKWPNDVLINGAKCAGILIEVAEGTAGKGLVIGFGVNLAAMPDDVPYQVAKLNDWGNQLSAPDAAAIVINHFFDLLTEPQAAVLQEWKKVAKGIGQPITANLPDRSIAGIFTDIQDDGALLIETATGMQKVYTADIFFGSTVA